MLLFSAVLESALPLCTYVEYEGREGETEPGSVASATPEKISRGLHPTYTTTAKEEKAERSLTLSLFS